MTSRTKVIMFHLLCFLIGFVGVVCGQTDCDQELTATSIPATHTSPNFPSNYPDNIRCIIRINSPGGSRIELNFTTFELEDSDDCVKDSLTIGNAIGEQLMFGPSCGTNWIWPRFPDRLIETLGSQVAIVFVTDSSDSARGFSFEYRYIHTTPELIFLTAETSIQYIYRRNAVSAYISETSMMNVSSVDFDPGSGFLFYGDSGARQISRRSTFTATPLSSEVIVTDVDPFSLRLDIPSQLLYWTDATLRTVSVTDFDGTHRSTIISDMDHPGAIVVEPYKGYIYYPDMGSPGKLERADGDGGDRITLARGVGQGLYNATTALAIDLEDRVLYWIDSSLGRLNSVRYDGTDHRPLSFIDGNPFALVIDSYAFIYTDPIIGRLRCDSRDLPGRDCRFRFSGGSTYYKGLTLRFEISSGAEPSALVCPNTTCSGLCLQKPNDQHRCVTGPPTVVCPEDIVEMSMEGESVQVPWMEPVDPVVTQSHHPGDSFPEGVTTVTYSLSKDGSIIDCSFTVTVIRGDNNLPLIIGVRGGVSVLVVIVIIVGAVLIVRNCRGASPQAEATDPGTRNPAFTQDGDGGYDTSVNNDNSPPYIEPTWDIQFGNDSAPPVSMAPTYDSSPPIPPIYETPDTQAEQNN